MSTAGGAFLSSQSYYCVECADEKNEVDLSRSLLSLITSYETGRDNQWWLTQYRVNRKLSNLFRISIAIAYLGPFLLEKHTGAIVGAFGYPLAILIPMHQISTWCAGITFRLATCFEFWFMLFMNVMTWILCSLSFYDNRSWFSITAFIGTTATLGLDANVITRHSTTISMVGGAILMPAIALAFWLRAVQDCSDLQFTVNGQRMTGMDVMANGLLTMTILFVKNILRLKRKSSENVVNLTIYKCALRIAEYRPSNQVKPTVPLTKTGWSDGKSTGRVAPMIAPLPTPIESFPTSDQRRRSHVTDEGKCQSAQLHFLGPNLSIQDKQTKHMTALKWGQKRDGKAPQLLASGDNVLYWLWSAPSRLISKRKVQSDENISQRSHTQSKRVWTRLKTNRWVYITLYLLTIIASPFSPVLGTLATLLLLVFYFSILNASLFLWLAKSFDVMFPSFQAIVAVACLSDAVFYDYRCFYLLTFLIWFHMTLVVDALTPHYKRILGFNKTTVLFLLLPALAGELWIAAMLLFTPTSDGTGAGNDISGQRAVVTPAFMLLRNRLIFSAFITDTKTVKLHVYGVVYSRMFTLIILTFRIFFKIITRPEEEFVLLTGNVELTLPEKFLTAKKYLQLLNQQKKKLDQESSNARLRPAHDESKNVSIPTPGAVADTPPNELGRQQNCKSKSLVIQELEHTGEEDDK